MAQLEGCNRYASSRMYTPALCTAFSCLQVLTLSLPTASDCMPSLHPHQLSIHRDSNLFILFYSCECCDCLTLCVVLQPSIFSVPLVWKARYQVLTIGPCQDLVQFAQRMRSPYLFVQCLASTHSVTTVYVPIVKRTTISPALHVRPEWMP